MIRKLLLCTLLILLSACSFGDMITPPTATPFPDVPADDFQIQYKWATGSLPPVYFYKYNILVGPGTYGKIVFQAGYSSDEPPPQIWTREFTITENDLDRLYQQLVQIGLFTKEWRQLDDIPVGGSADSLTVNAYGQVYSIPAYVSGDQQARDLNTFYDEINALVPQSTWNELYGLHDAYVLEHEDEE